MSQDKKNHPIIALKALLAGREVAIGAHTYRYLRAGETIESRGETLEVTQDILLQKAVSERTVNGVTERTIAWLGVEMRLEDFIAETEAMSAGDAFVVAAETAMQNIAARRAADREKRAEAKARLQVAGAIC